MVCGREDCEEYSRRYCRDRGEANQRGNVRGLLDDELLSHCLATPVPKWCLNRCCAWQFLLERAHIHSSPLADLTSVVLKYIDSSATPAPRLNEELPTVSTLPLKHRRRNTRLKPYDALLRKFQYQAALDASVFWECLERFDVCVCVFQFDGRNVCRLLDP